jgi:hypothetical protein
MMVMRKWANGNKVENFNNQNLMLIYSKWKSIKSAIERAVNLINYLELTATR